MSPVKVMAPKRRMDTKTPRYTSSGGRLPTESGGEAAAWERFAGEGDGRVESVALKDRGVGPGDGAGGPGETAVGSWVGVGGTSQDIRSSFIKADTASADSWSVKMETPSR